MPLLKMPPNAEDAFRKIEHDLEMGDQALSGQKEADLLHLQAVLETYRRIKDEIANGSVQLRRVADDLVDAEFMDEERVRLRVLDEERRRQQIQEVKDLLNSKIQECKEKDKVFQSLIKQKKELIVRAQKQEVKDTKIQEDFKLEINELNTKFHYVNKKKREVKNLTKELKEARSETQNLK